MAKDMAAKDMAKDSISMSEKVIITLLLLGMPVTLILLVVTILTMNLMFAFIGLVLSLVGAIGSYYIRTNK